MKQKTQNGSAPTTDALVLRRFRVVFNAVRNHFQHVEKQTGLGSAQLWALSVVRDSPGIGMGGIAKGMDIHQSTASNLIKTLLRRELISMAKAPEDRRNVQLYILPAGLIALGQVTAPFEGVLSMALGKLPQETLQRLNQNLGELVQLLKTDEQASGVPLIELWGKAAPHASPAPHEEQQPAGDIPHE